MVQQLKNEDAVTSKLASTAGIRLRVYMYYVASENTPCSPGHS